jgi:4-amino-4-deoxy-L-arabinose transferase-like glycosyltransferase
VRRATVASSSAGSAPGASAASSEWRTRPHTLPTVRAPVTSTYAPERSSQRWAPWLCAGLLLTLAAALRLWSVQRVNGNVFYDAAVRTMGQSWHALFFGALEPGGSVSIDKPPVDLWLQVASTKALGFTLFGLHLPEALGGVAACGLLFGALRRPFGLVTALAAALALAVLPVSVLTARSDTMDSVLAALLIGALWLSFAALESGRLRWSVLAAAALGLAFNVKLTEALIALPALALVWLWAAEPTLRARLRVTGATAATFIAVALSWTAIASLTPLGQRPFPVGSGDGSVWRVTFVYNGLNRLSNHGAIGGAALAPGGGPSPLRLLSAGSSELWSLVGTGVLAASLLGLLALTALLAQGRERLREALRSPRGRFAVGIVVWFLTGLIVFSAMRRLQTRYLEAFTPAICAVLGLAVGALWRGGGPRRAILLGFLLVAFLATSLSHDFDLIRGHHSNSLQADPTSVALSRYLRANREGTRYEVAAANINDVVGLVARDAQPVLVMNDVDGSLTRTRGLQAKVAAGQVRYYFAPHACHGGRHCPGNQLWAYAHSVPVRGVPGLRRFGLG